MVELLLKEFLAIGLQKTLALGFSLLIVFAGVVLLSIVVDWVTKKLLLRGIKVFIRKSRHQWDDIALKKRVFHRLAHFAPAMVFYLSAGLFNVPNFPWTQYLAEFIRRGSTVIMAIVGLMVVDAVLNTLKRVYRNFEVAKQKPINSYVQVAKIFIYILGAILIVALLLDKSPWGLLTGLGAMTAIILLIFRDSILGLVASVQISAYDMVRIGDWIQMPKFGADGDVMDMSLNTVKVRNWDKTIVTIPTYALLSESVVNWRGMEMSGGRRIKRAVYIDMNTIKFCDQEMIKRFSKIHYIAEYIQNKIDEIQKYNLEKKVDTSTLANGRHLTNVGTFRAYIEAYLRHHPKIHQEMTFLIRHLEPTDKGLPIQIYVFTNDTVWAHYEGIQADIFDHILAVAPEFDLRIFQSTAGQNFRVELLREGEPFPLPEKKKLHGPPGS